MLCSVSQAAILQYYFSLTLKFCWTLSVVKVGCKSISITVKIKVSGYDISYVSPEPDKKWRWVRRSIFSMRQETRDNMASWRMNWKWDSTQSAVSTTLHCSALWVFSYTWQLWTFLQIVDTFWLKLTTLWSSWLHAFHSWRRGGHLITIPRLRLMTDYRAQSGVRIVRVCVSPDYE